MFSGIVEEMGLVSSLVKNDAVKLWDGTMGEGVELTVKAKKVLEGATDGCSISVNGVCLTVTEFDDQEFKVNFCKRMISQTSGIRFGNLEGIVELGSCGLMHLLHGDRVPRW